MVVFLQLEIVDFRELRPDISLRLERLSHESDSWRKDISRDIVTIELPSDIYLVVSSYVRMTYSSGTYPVTVLRYAPLFLRGLNVRT